MATALTLSRIVATIAGTFKSTEDLQVASVSVGIGTTDALTNGTAANQADVLWSDSSSIPLSDNELIDLHTSLSNVFGGAATFVKVRGIFIHNKSTTAGYKLKIGAAGVTAFNTWLSGDDDFIYLEPDGVLLLTSPIDGYAVVQTDGDILKITNDNAGAVEYDIAIWGTSA